MIVVYIMHRFIFDKHAADLESNDRAGNAKINMNDATSTCDFMREVPIEKIHRW